jgi:PAS domain-containing protein
MRDGGRGGADESATTRAPDAAFRAMADGSRAAISIQDGAGRYVYANPRFRELFAAPGAAVEGLSDDELFPAPEAVSLRMGDAATPGAGGHPRTMDTLSSRIGPRAFSIERLPLCDARASPGPSAASRPTSRSSGAPSRPSPRTARSTARSARPRSRRSSSPSAACASSRTARPR